jgi:hypothetical protein
MRYAGEHEDLGDVLEADDAHKDRVWRLGGPAQEYSAPGLPQRKYASVAMAREGLDGSGANGRIWPAMMSAELPEGWA